MTRNFIVSLVMKFNRPLPHDDLTASYAILKSACQGLGLATPARAAFKALRADTILIEKMSCTLQVYQRLLGLVSLEDPKDEVRLMKNQIKEVSIVTKKLASPDRGEQTYSPHHYEIGNTTLPTLHPPTSLPTRGYSIGKPSLIQAEPKVSEGLPLLSTSKPTDTKVLSSGATSKLAKSKGLGSAASDLTDLKRSPSTITSKLTDSKGPPSTATSKPKVAKVLPLASTSKPELGTIVNSTPSLTQPSKPTVVKGLPPVNHTLPNTIGPKVAEPTPPPNLTKPNVRTIPEPPIPSSSKHLIEDVENMERPTKKLKIEDSPELGTPLRRSLRLRNEASERLAAQKDAEAEMLRSLQSANSELEKKLRIRTREIELMVKAFLTQKQELDTMKSRNEILVRKQNEELQMLKQTGQEEIEHLRKELAAEKSLRIVAEKVVEEVRRELRHPFIVPGLLDAFVLFSKSNASLSTSATSSHEPEPGETS